MAKYSSQMLSETDGRVVLREAFEAQGYTILEDYWLELAGLRVQLDGYDPQARIGYEYVTREDGVSADELEHLMEQRHCLLFLIDENRVPDASTLLEAVFEFFRQAEQRE